MEVVRQEVQLAVCYSFDWLGWEGKTMSEHGEGKV
jgi:hypothetical protein